ncbi:MAG: proline dehydrogenase family protein [Actinomycetota bacterium]|nr:proline dehydrogenase family protein [Actinomycetota bacterium]
MLRSLVVGVAHNKLIRKAATGGAGRKVATRFVAGESLGEAIRVIRELNAEGASVSIDYLGENVTDLGHAAAATDMYVRALDAIGRERLLANVSVKLTAIGLDVDPAAAERNARAITERARDAGTSVTLDMEDHHYTDRTVDACVRLAGEFPGAAGVALQAYLRRTGHDLERLVESGAHVRLCKGAYLEPRAIAYRARKDVDAAFKDLATRLLASTSYAMIATHDEEMIRHAESEARRLGRAQETYEFQMLYGVRRELQSRLLSRGENLRVYVPYGEQWYPYLTRRIAERPGNVRFFAEALFRK